MIVRERRQAHEVEIVAAIRSFSAAFRSRRYFIPKRILPSTVSHGNEE